MVEITKIKCLSLIRLSNSVWPIQNFKFRLKLRKSQISQQLSIIEILLKAEIRKLMTIAFTQKKLSSIISCGAQVTKFLKNVAKMAHFFKNSLTLVPVEIIESNFFWVKAMILSFLNLAIKNISMMLSCWDIWVFLNLNQNLKFWIGHTVCDNLTKLEHLIFVIPTWDLVIFHYQNLLSL